MKKLFIPLMLCFILFSGCYVIDVNPTPVEIIINTSIEPLPIDGHWRGTLRDDQFQLQVADWNIGPDGNQRILTGTLFVLDPNIPGMIPQPFVAQYTGNGMIVHDDGSWQINVFLTTFWDVSGWLIDSNTMKIRIAHHPEGVTYTLHRVTAH